MRFIEFDPSTNWAGNLAADNWLAIVLTKQKNKSYFEEIIRKTIDNNVRFICSVGEQHDLVHNMADEEIMFRDVKIEPLHLPDQMIAITGHEHLEEGI